MKRKRKVRTRNIPRKPDVRPAHPVSVREKAFCDRWLVHHDAKKAFLEAGYAKSGKSRHIVMLAKFRRYLEGRLPVVEKELAKTIAYERTDILAGIARIANANAQDYVEVFDTIDTTTGDVVKNYRLKSIQELTRDQASAIDSVSQCPLTGKITYTLPDARTRLAAFTTLGEQAAGFSQKNTTHNHLHLANIPLEQLRHVKGLLMDMAGPDVSRQIFGVEPQEESDTSP